jgi:hypothetical protein
MASKGACGESILDFTVFDFKSSFHQLSIPLNLELKKSAAGRADCWLLVALPSYH